ncbi:hypothetical protein BX666DRAFT_2026886 [Dichotomocladium elegans]|nr:hypothetical protein BX666DRAFT_2026886 [Dichotomocladium elegans]
MIPSKQSSLSFPLDGGGMSTTIPFSALHNPWKLLPDATSSGEIPDRLESMLHPYGLLWPTHNIYLSKAGQKDRTNKSLLAKPSLSSVASSCPSTSWITLMGHIQDVSQGLPIVVSPVIFLWLFLYFHDLCIVSAYHGIRSRSSCHCKRSSYTRSTIIGEAVSRLNNPSLAAAWYHHESHLETYLMDPLCRSLRDRHRRHRRHRRQHQPRDFQRTDGQPEQLMDLARNALSYFESTTLDPDRASMIYLLRNICIS